MQWHNTPTSRLICLHFQRPEEAETPCPGPSVHRNLLPNGTRWQTHLEPSRAPKSERFTEIFDGLIGYRSFQPGQRVTNGQVAWNHPVVAPLNAAAYLRLGCGCLGFGA